MVAIGGMRLNKMRAHACVALDEVQVADLSSRMQWKDVHPASCSGEEQLPILVIAGHRFHLIICCRLTCIL